MTLLHRSLPAIREAAVGAQAMAPPPPGLGRRAGVDSGGGVQVPERGRDAPLIAALFDGCRQVTKNA